MGGEPIRESAAYETLCYMIDESRNAVTNMKEIRPFIRTLATLGYEEKYVYLAPFEKMFTAAICE